VNLLSAAGERRGAILALALALAVAGVAAALRLPASIFPSVTFPVVKVIADVGEEPAARMMPTVTRPLEEAILRVPGIRRVLSTTSRGSTEISGHFEWGTDMQLALQRVQGEIGRIRTDLPNETRVDVEWMNTAIFPILGFAITSPTRGLSDLWDLAEFRLKPELVRIPGVAQVQIQGGRKREFQVRLDGRALAARRLSAADVVEAIRKNNQVLSAGLTEANHELYLTLVDGRAEGLDALSRIAVPVPEGVSAHLSELATIAAADAVSYVRTSADGRPAVLVNIVRQPSANTVAIAESIRRLFRDRPDLLPPGVTWSNFYDQAEFVSQSVRGVRDAILIGVVLAALVLLVFLRSVRLTLVAVLTIPVCVAIVFLLLSATGQTINLMTLGGVAAALGLIADDAIVVVENIHRYRQEGIEDPSVRGLADLAPALVGSSLSTVVIFVPFALLTGVAGAFFRPLALTMALALAVSFVLAALAVPAAASSGRLGSRVRSRREAPRGSRFDRVTAFFIGRAWVAPAVTAALLAGGFFLYRAIGTDFLPSMDEGSIILDYWTPPGTSLTDTEAMLREAERIILSLPDVQTYSRRTGEQLGFFITEPNSGDYVIKLKPRSRRRPVEEVIDDLRDRLAAAEPAIRADFGQLLEDDIGDLTGDVPQPVDVKVFGEDQGLIQQKAREAASKIRNVPGVEDVFDGIVVAGPSLDIRPQASTARGAGMAGVEPTRFGLTTEELHAAVEPAIAGTVAGSVRIGERMFDVRVFQKTEGSLTELKIRTPSGALLPLGAVATVTTGEPEVEIQRDNLKTFLGVTARLSGRDLGGAIGEIRSKLATNVAIPAGVSLQFGGLYEQQQASFKGLLLVLVGGLVLVGIVVLFEFGDWRAPLLTAVIALAVLAGVFGILIVTGMTLNVSSFVGAIMMVGIVGENAVFVVHEARRALREGVPVEEAWRRAARRRLRPVAMTVLATAFALMPLAFALGAGSQLQQPLAIAVIGGFLLSGPLVLLVLPGLYRALDPRGRLSGAVARSAR
jgi:CzcA family heavy metal efflux pump